VWEEKSEEVKSEKAKSEEVKTEEEKPIDSPEKDVKKGKNDYFTTNRESEEGMIHSPDFGTLKKESSKPPTGKSINRMFEKAEELREKRKKLQSTL